MSVHSRPLASGRTRREKRTRYYYVDREMKIVSVCDAALPETTPLDHLGSTDNPFIKVAIAHFLNDEPGYLILDHTDGT